MVSHTSVLAAWAKQEQVEEEERWLALLEETGLWADIRSSRWRLGGQRRGAE